MSAFNHLKHGPTLDTVKTFSPENEGFIRQFLRPRQFQISWNGAPKRWAHAEEGTPQGSPLSPVLWLLFLAITLKKTDRVIKEEISLKLDIRKNPARKASDATRLIPDPEIQVDLYSYADDVNPVVTTRGTSRKKHAHVVREVNRILEATAKEHDLSWDQQKDSKVDFNETGPLQSTTTLGCTINSRLSFQEHVNTRTKKAERIWQVMKRLGNNNGGLSPLALRLLYTGMIRPIFTYGAEIWLHNPPNLETFRRLEYQALRKITGAYHDSSHEKLGFIANIEPIQDKLADMGACWAAKAISTGDPQIRALLQEDTPGWTAWHDGTKGPRQARETPIGTAFHLTAISVPEEISWGNSQDHRTGDLLQITLLTPTDPRSREKGYWAAALAQLVRDGWSLAYSDGSGKDLNVGSGAYVPESKLEEGAFLGNLASVADGERRGMTLAINAGPRDKKLCVLSDSFTAILQLSRGDPPRSGIETDLRTSILSRQQPTAVAWIRGHLGLEGNTRADHLAELHSHLGVVSLQPRTATHEGLRAASRANRKTIRTQPGFGKRRTDWHRHALTAYTWFRTERGPQRAWLHHIRKIDDPTCPCGHTNQTGEHITFHCPRHAFMRGQLLRSKGSWREIDDPDWRKEGDEDFYDAIESFFDYLYNEF